MEYPNPGVLVSTEWLAEHLDDPDLCILDATQDKPPMAPRTAIGWYRERHISGAQYFDIEDICDDTPGALHMLPTAEVFAKKAGELGIGNSSQIVVYDALGGFAAAARAWWMFRVYGCENVKYLDGGLPKWIAEGRPVEAGDVSRQPAAFHANRMDMSLVHSREQMLEIVENGGKQIVDARPMGRFTGEAPEPRPGLKSGHMRGAVCLFYETLMNADGDWTLLSADDLRQRITDAGIDLDKPIVTTCGSGVTACIPTLAFYLLGRKDVAVYDGSWTEWASHGGMPIETGSPA